MIACKNFEATLLLLAATALYSASMSMMSGQLPGLLSTLHFQCGTKILCTRGLSSISGWHETDCRRLKH